MPCANEPQPLQKPEARAEGKRSGLGDTNAHSLGSRLGLGWKHGSATTQQDRNVTEARSAS